MATAYIETTIPSYYTARRSKSLLQAGRQLTTQQWWDGGHSGFELVTSTETLNEIREGDPAMAAARLKLLAPVRVIPVTNRSAELAIELVRSGIVPAVATPDAVHISIAATAAVDFLVTWNFKHIANPYIRDRMREKIEKFGARMPVMCSQEELLTDDDDS